MKQTLDKLRKLRKPIISSYVVINKGQPVILGVAQTKSITTK